jgi:hypothetical protein
VSAEVSARRTAAAAVLADFRRAADEYIDEAKRTVPRPDYSMWAWRLSSELTSVLQQLEAEASEAAPDPAAGQLADVTRAERVTWLAAEQGAGARDCRYLRQWRRPRGPVRQLPALPRRGRRAPDDDWDELDDEAGDLWEETAWAGHDAIAADVRVSAAEVAKPGHRA